MVSIFLPLAVIAMAVPIGCSSGGGGSSSGRSNSGSNSGIKTASGRYGPKVRVYVYPMDKPYDINAAVLAANSGWVHNEWNDHNQYIVEHVFHSNLLHDDIVRTKHGNEADFYFLPFYARMALYNKRDLHRLRAQALSTLRTSPWFRSGSHRQKRHLVVWSSQRRPADLLGQELFDLLRPHAIFLAVEPADTRPGTLRLLPRDIVIPSYVPASRIQLVNDDLDIARATTYGTHDVNEGGQRKGMGAGDDDRIVSLSADDRYNERNYHLHRHHHLPLPTDAPPKNYKNKNKKHTSHSQRPIFAFFLGTLANSPVRDRLAEAFSKGNKRGGSSDRDIDNTKILPLNLTPHQDNNTASDDARALKAVLQQASAYMSRSRFCLAPRGKTPGTRRLFEALAHCCIPVLVSDPLTLPFERHVDARGGIVRIAEASAGDARRLLEALLPGEVEARRRDVCRLRHAFIWHMGTAVLGDAYYNVLAELQDRLTAMSDG